MSQSPDSAATSIDPGDRVRRIITLVSLTVLLIAVLAGMDILVLSRNNPAQALSPHYYMALGDSLSFGYQPNLDFSAGFADDIFNDLHRVNVTGVVNYACAGESTDTMIHGACVGHILHHGSYTGPQLQAAIDFLTRDANSGHVSPITLEIGSNDVSPDWDRATCTATASAEADLTRMDDNLTQVILPKLLAALGTPKSGPNGDLHLLNYYNPFIKECPNSTAFVHELNDHLSADAAQFKIPVVDVYTAFGGDQKMADSICTLTWVCDPRFKDIHPTDAGYKLIAQAVEFALGLPGNSPLPVIATPISAAPLPLAAFKRQSGGVLV